MKDNISNTVFLELLENIYMSKGLSGIKKYITDVFKIGNCINIDYGNSLKSVFILKGFSIHKLEQNEIIYMDGTIDNIPLIRSVNLPYVEDPFQIDFYGFLKI
jgi:hypothetical protein